MLLFVIDIIVLLVTWYKGSKLKKYNHGAIPERYLSIMGVAIIILLFYIIIFVS